MELLFFHGTEILALFGGAFVGLGIFVSMLVWAFRGPSRTWTIPLLYMVVGLSISIAEIITGNFFGLSVMFAFPWSVLLVFVSTAIDRDLGLVWFIPFILFNAGIVILIARYQRRH